MASLLKSCSTWDFWSNMPYGDTSPNQVFDLRVPKGNNTTTNPLIVWVHGGGWQTGTEDPRVPDGLPFDYTPLVKRGFAVASVRYRLSGEAIWPAQIQDVLGAVRTLRALSGQWRIWPNKFALWGGSAGGHLAALAALAGNDAAFQAGNWLGTSAAIHGCLVDFAPSNLRSWVQTAGYEQWASAGSQLGLLFGGQSVLDIPEIADNASPALRVGPSSPLMFLRHGTADTIVPVQQSRELRDRYVAQGLASKVALQEFGGKGHADPSFYTSGVVSGAGDLFNSWLQP